MTPPRGPLVILGTGHAGYTLARELRRLDPSRPVTLVTRDDGHAYYKPDLSKAFASGKDADGLIRSSVGQVAQELNARVLANTQATAIDVTGRRLVLGEGAPLEYSALVLASGAQPIRLPVTGNAAGQVMSVNDRLDYARFRRHLVPGARVLIVGAGLIGCEWANDLGAHGFQVSVVDVAPWPLPRLLPEPLGRALQAALEGIGVRFHLGDSLDSLDENGGALAATLSSGAVLGADRVMTAVGLRADVSLARAAGLECALGIKVDAHMQTSAEDIYALGDCVEIGGRLLPFILPITHAARALAQTLCGKRTPAQFPPMPVLVKTPACPVVVCPPPPVAGAWQVSGHAPDLEAIFSDARGKPCGFALTGTSIARRGALAAAMPAIR